MLFEIDSRDVRFSRLHFSAFRLRFLYQNMNNVVSAGDSVKDHHQTLSGHVNSCWTWSGFRHWINACSYEQHQGFLLRYQQFRIRKYPMSDFNRSTANVHDRIQTNEYRRTDFEKNNSEADLAAIPFGSQFRESASCSSNLKSACQHDRVLYRLP